MLKYVNVSLSEGDTETDHPVAVRPKVAIIVRSMRIVHNLGARMSSNVARFCRRRRRRRSKQLLPLSCCRLEQRRRGGLHAVARRARERGRGRARVARVHARGLGSTDADGPKGEHRVGRIRSHCVTYMLGRTYNRNRTNIESIAPYAYGPQEVRSASLGK